MSTQYHVHTQNSAHDLLNDLVASVHDDQKDLMTDEVILVPTTAMTRALRHQITKRHGVFAGISLMTIDQYANRLRMDIARQELSANMDAEQAANSFSDPWSESNLAWEILAALENPAFIEDQRVTGQPTTTQDTYASDSLAYWLGLDFEKISPQKLYEEACSQTLEQMVGDAQELARMVAEVGAQWVLKQVPTGEQTHLALQPLKTKPHELKQRGDTIDLPYHLLFDVLTSALTPRLTHAFDQKRTKLSCTSTLTSSSLLIDICVQELLQSLKAICSDELLTDELLRPCIDVTKIKYFPDQASEIIGLTHQRIVRACTDVNRHAKSIRDLVVENLQHEQANRAAKQQEARQVDLRVRRARRASWAEKTAKRFLHYLGEAPHLILAWEAAKDVAPSSDSLDLDAELPAHLRWQPLLWRVVLSQISERYQGTAPVHPGRFMTQIPAQDLQAVCAKRIHLYGYTMFNRAQAAFMSTLSRASAVHIYTLTPLRSLNQDSDVLRLPAPVSWDMQRLAFNQWLKSLSDSSQSEHQDPVYAPLEQTSFDQDGLTFAPPVFHACMGEQRQIEVVQNLITRRLTDKDRRVYPEDIAILVPQQTRSLPLLVSQFNKGKDRLKHPALSLPLWSWSELAQKDPDPYKLVQAALNIARGRVRRSDILNLLALPCVQKRMRLVQEDIACVEEMLDATHVHWGWHGHEAQRSKVSAQHLHSWIAGLTSLALGFGAAPQFLNDAVMVKQTDGLSTTQIPLISTLIHFLEELHDWCDRVAPKNNAYATCHSLSTWAELLGELTEKFCVAACEQDSLALHAINRFIASLSATSQLHPTLALSLEEMQQRVDHFDTVRTLTTQVQPGAIHVWRPEDLAYIPYACVILLDINSNNFPGHNRMDGDSVLSWVSTEPVVLRARSKLLADTDDARTALQHAMVTLSQAQEIHIVYSGRDALTGKDIPIPEVLQELTSQDSNHLIYYYEHPLMNFLEEQAYRLDDHEKKVPATHPEPYATYEPLAQTHYDIFVSKDGKQSTDLEDYYRAYSFISPDDQEALTITPRDICAFLTRPIQKFCNQTLHVYYADTKVSDDDIIPTQVDLPTWQKNNIVAELLGSFDQGTDPFVSDRFITWLQDQIKQGVYPTECVSRPVFESLYFIAQRIAKRMELSNLPLTSSEPVEAVAINLKHTLISGEVEGLVGNHVSIIAANRDKLLSSIDTAPEDSHNVYRALCANLLLQAHGAEISPHIYYIFNTKTQSATYEPYFSLPDKLRSQENALRWLDRIARIYRVGQQMPLPLIHTYALTYVSALLNGLSREEALDQVIQKARTTGVSSYEQPYHELLWGPSYSLTDLFMLAPHEDALAWIFSPEHHQAYLQYLTERYQPQTFFELLALALWEELLAPTPDPERS